MTQLVAECVAMKKWQFPPESIQGQFIRRVVISLESRDGSNRDWRMLNGPFCCDPHSSVFQFPVVPTRPPRTPDWKRIVCMQFLRPLLTGTPDQR